MEPFKEAMWQTGITPPVNIIPDGNLHRFHVEGDKPRSENGWYVLHDDPLAGAFGCWKRNIQEKWSSREYKTFTPEEKASYRANMEAQKQQRETEQARIHEECREKSKAIWNNAKPATENHPYLIRKNVKAHGLKEYKGLLVAPVRDGKTLHGLQFIAPEKDETGRDKYFKTGTNKKGRYHSIGGKPESVLYLAEGYATGATIHEATRQPVAVCFDASNLKPVAEVLRKKLPAIKIVICADNDTETEGNPGKAKATEAALSISGMVAVVQMPAGKRGTDFNDLHKLEGLEAVKRQIGAAEDPSPYPSPAGDQPTEAEVEDQNEAPLLFDEIQTPDIPPALLPGWLGAYVEAVARHTQTPPAMAVMLGLAAVATCTAKRFEVAPNGDGYSEPLNLWTATALPPASRKTAVISAMTAPHAEWEKEEAERLAPEIKRANIKRRTLEKRRDKLEKEAANTNDTMQRECLLRDIEQLETEIPEELRTPRLWTGDTTPERLQMLLAEHGERMAVLTDEGGIFEVMAGLYSDGRANLDIFLQSHAGRAVRVDRQTRTAHLDAPALTFGLAIQPAILGEMGQGGKRRFRGNGTLARFLFAVPRSNIGSRDVRESHPIPETVATRYRAGIFELLEILPQTRDGQETPRRLTLTPEALDCWHAFGQMIEQRQGEGGDLEAIQDWSGKLPGAALRIAGNFHIVENGGNPPAQIEEVTIEKALDLCGLLVDHAKAAFNMMDADPTTADAKAIFKWIETERLPRFRRGEAYRQFKGRFTGKTERLDKAIKDLKARAIVTPSTEPTAGRSATVFMVNPTLWRDA